MAQTFLTFVKYLVILWDQLSEQRIRPLIMHGKTEFRIWRSTVCLYPNATCSRLEHVAWTSKIIYVTARIAHPKILTYSKLIKGPLLLLRSFVCWGGKFTTKIFFTFLTRVFWHFKDLYTTIFGLGMFRTLSFMVKVDIYRDRNNAKWTIAIAPPLKKAHSKEGQHNLYLEQETFVGCF